MRQGEGGEREKVVISSGLCWGKEGKVEEDRGVCEEKGEIMAKISGKAVEVNIQTEGLVVVLNLK